MMKKRLLLCVVATSLLISNKNMAADFHPAKVAICGIIAFAATMVGGAAVYTVGQSCGFWGGPNLKMILNDAETGHYNATQTYEKWIGLFKSLGANENFLQAAVEERLDVRNVRFAI